MTSTRTGRCRWSRFTTADSMSKARFTRLPRSSSCTARLPGSMAIARRASAPATSTSRVSTITLPTPATSASTTRRSKSIDPRRAVSSASTSADRKGPRSRPRFRSSSEMRSLLTLLVYFVLAVAPPPTTDSYVVNDSHLHLTNYVQQGTDIHDFMKIMGTKVGRVALFGIPLQQEWSYANTGSLAPTYYLQTDAPLYYYSFTDAYIAMAYRSLP